MADEQKIRDVLTAAKKRKLLIESETECICFTSTLNTANKILFLVKQAEDVDVKQLCSRLDFHPNTIRIYLRVLAELGFLKSLGKKHTREIIWYLN